MAPMKQRTTFVFALFLNLILAFALSGQAAHASSMKPPAVVTPASATECNLSRQAFLPGGCPDGGVGAASNNPAWTGGTVEPKSDARPAIDAFGFCRYVGNSGDKPLFVPFGDEEEWRAYITNHPQPIYLLQCSRGGNVPVPPNFGADGVTNQCTTAPPVQTIFAPYKPANLNRDFTAPPVTYTCKSGDGTEFQETAVASLESHDSGYGPSDDIGWKITKILYTYNGVCGSAKGIETKTAPVAGLCSVGIPSKVIGVGPFQWICNGGNGGGKNITCTTATPCEAHIVETKACRCETGDCYVPVYWEDGCGHSWVDKSKKCDNPEPTFKPLPPIDYDNDHLNR